MKVTHTDTLIPAPENGKPGPPAVVVTLSTNNIIFKKMNAEQRVLVDVSVFEGSKRVSYGKGGDDGFLCSTLKNVSGLKVTYLIHHQDHEFCYGFMLADNTVVDVDYEITVTYKNIEYKKHLSCKVVENGSKGDKGGRGAILRHGQSWKDYPFGYIFEAGGENDKYLDYVEHNGYWYICNKTHEKSSANFPGNSNGAASKFWELGTNYGLVATMLLLSKYALIKNLGAEAIEMTDSNGRIVFSARDGAVTCNTGNFDNVHVKGVIEAESGIFSGFVKRCRTNISKENFMQYIDESLTEHGPNGHDRYSISIEKTGAYITFASNLPKDGSIKNIIFGGYVKESTRHKTFEQALDFLGTQVIIYTGDNLTCPPVTGNMRYTGTEEICEPGGTCRLINVNYKKIDDKGGMPDGNYIVLHQNSVYVITCEIDKEEKGNIIWHCIENKKYNY